MWFFNIAKKDRTIIPNFSWSGRDNGLVAQPFLLKLRWIYVEPRRIMNTQKDKPLRSKNLPT